MNTPNGFNKATDGNFLNVPKDDEANDSRMVEGGEILKRIRIKSDQNQEQEHSVM